MQYYEKFISYDKFNCHKTSNENKYDKYIYYFLIFN